MLYFFLLYFFSSVIKEMIFDVPKAVRTVPIYFFLMAKFNLFYIENISKLWNLADE